MSPEPPRISCLQCSQVVPLVPVFSFSAYFKALPPIYNLIENPDRSITRWGGGGKVNADAMGLNAVE